MKLFIFDNGKIILPAHHYLGQRKGPNYSIPVPMYLIDHPKQGIILFDIGMEWNHWPDFMKSDGITTPDQRIDVQMNKLGYYVKDVKHVIISHMHLDHAGQIMLFPHATIHIRKSEWNAALNKLSGGYIFDDYMGALNFNFDFIPEDIDVDLFGDGTIFCIDTKGHTAGHQSLLINLPNTGKVVLASDAALLAEDLDKQDFLQNENFDSGYCIKSIGKLKKLRGEGIFIIYGHDPEQWRNLKKAPEYYD